MAKQIVVRHYGVFRRSQKRKKGKVEKLRRYMRALHAAWVGD